MREKDLKEDLATMAYKAEADHEVQMARADLYKIAKYAIQMHEMLKGVTEEQGLEGWVQSKITKASDYLGAVYHHMDYEQKFESVAESTDDDVDESGIMYKAGVKKYGKEGMKKIQSAAGKGASAEEIGAIKDKHNKKKKESIDENQVPASANVLKLVVGDYKKLKAEQDLMAKQGYDEDVEMIERRLKDLRQMAELIKDGGYLAGVDTAVADDIVDYYKRAGEPLPFARESVEEGRMAGYSKYHCKDCGCQMHNCKSDCDCSHDSHDETGSWWRDENGNGVPDVMETSYTHTLMQRLEENLAKKKIDERSLTKGEEKKKEKYVKGMKKAKGDFKDRYGDDAEAVMYATATKMAKKNESYNTLEESVGKPITEAEFERLAEKKDACYHKVKSRYKVWPSAYASGALVQCRKKGAKNWGNKSK